MSLREHLQDIYDRRGQLTPALVVDEARPKTSPLHERFEWDNRVAGEAWRRQQAHEMIRSVRVVYREATDDEPERTVRQWHAVRSDDVPDHVYEPAEKVATDPVMREIVLRDMQREWKQLHDRYGAFAEFVDMVSTSLASTPS